MIRKMVARDRFESRRSVLNVGYELRVKYQFRLLSPNVNGDWDFFSVVRLL